MLGYGQRTAQIRLVLATVNMPTDHTLAYMSAGKMHTQKRHPSVAPAVWKFWGVNTPEPTPTTLTALVLAAIQFWIAGQNRRVTLEQSLTS